MLEQPHREFGLGSWVWQSGRGFLLEQPHKEFGLESWVWWGGVGVLIRTSSFSYCRLGLGLAATGLVWLLSLWAEVNGKRYTV